jgi:hypothetical protein
MPKAPAGDLVEAGAQVVGLRAEFHAATSLIFTCEPSAGADDDLLELLGVLEQAEGADVELAFLPGGAGSAPMRPAGDWAFCSLIAFLMSCGVMPSEASLSGAARCASSNPAR